ncbi:DedA family protein [Cellulomonas soli]|uniref:Membrane protein DedA with SNARE-associated domain n=1 Tax=Cellulomonas soli TaxID=931535 RepID=A0A512PDI2_9CELL|nr:hypothetical protein [Cellulomonas soli]NYI60165.1 membrane protein DedA with SNARE-associated domain [Cellulomonas soli]GEP69182.1 hypothetical protein CSO01_18970 [Cellulomonas soli]
MTDVAEAYGLGGLPIAGVLAALFLIVLARSHGTYWLARAVTRVGTSGRGPAWWRALLVRADGWSATPGARRGRALVHRWGPVAVTAAYVTVGLQTAVMLAAGLLRMPYLRFTLASLPGAAAWAVIWGTVGLGAVWGAVRLAAASPWALAVVLLAVAVGVVLRWRTRRAAVADPAAPAAQGAALVATEAVRD